MYQDTPITKDLIEVKREMDNIFYFITYYWKEMRKLWLTRWRETVDWSFTCMLNHLKCPVLLVWFSVVLVILPEAWHGPLMREMSSMAMSPASPPTVASRITWWTFCKVTWICTSSHSSPWFPDCCHTYRKDRRLIHWSQWGCEVFATPWYALKLCNLHSLYSALMLFCNQHFTTMWKV